MEQIAIRPNQNGCSSAVSRFLIYRMKIPTTYGTLIIGMRAINSEMPPTTSRQPPTANCNAIPKAQISEPKDDDKNEEGVTCYQSTQRCGTEHAFGWVIGGGELIVHNVRLILCTESERIQVLHLQRSLEAEIKQRIHPPHEPEIPAQQVTRAMRTPALLNQ
jgi:hypothetical protein